MSIESVMPSNHLILCHPLLLPPSIFPSIRVFSKESVLRIRWPKYCSFSFSISPSIENSGLISFRMDWLDLLTVQGTLKSLLQVRGIKCIFDLMIFSTNNGFIRLKPHWKLRKICTRIHKLKGFLKGRSLSSLGTVVEEKYITTFPLVPWLCI